MSAAGSPFCGAAWVEASARARTPTPGTAFATPALPDGGSGAPAGFVLFAAILLVALAAVSIATGSWLAARAVVVANSRADALRARLAAESAARVAAASWRAGEERALPLLGEVALADVVHLAGGAEGRASVRRLGGELYLLRGEGRAGTARARAALLVRVVSPDSFLPPFPAAIAAEGVRLGASAIVGVLPPDAPPPAWAPGRCDPTAADSLAAIFGRAARPGVAVGERGLDDAGAAIEGDPPIARGLPPADSARFGPLSWTQLTASADRTESGGLHLTPSEHAARCDTAADGNWGAPLDPSSACGDYFPLIYAPGDLELLGGAGQGVLIVRGRLELRGDARFYGPIFVAGDVESERTVAVWGAVRARGAAWDGRVEYSACALLRALSRAPGLGRAWRTGARLWLPAF